MHRSFLAINTLKIVATSSGIGKELTVSSGLPPWYLTQDSYSDML